MLTVCAVQDLRDRNDELSSEVELLKNQKSCRREQEADAPSWTEHQQATEFDSGKKTRVLNKSEGSREEDGNSDTWWIEVEDSRSMKMFHQTVEAGS